MVPKAKRSNYLGFQNRGLLNSTRKYQNIGAAVSMSDELPLYEFKQIGTYCARQIVKITRRIILTGNLYAKILRKHAKCREMTVFFQFVLLAAGSPAGAQITDLIPRGNEQPSFDCSAGKSAAARLICADAELTRLDRALGAAFQRQKLQVYAPDQPRFIADQLSWIRERNERCGLVGKSSETIDSLAGSKPCLMNSIQDRIRSFDMIDQASDSSGEEPPTRMPGPPKSQTAQPQLNWPNPQKAIGVQSAPNSAPQQQQTAGSAKLDAAKQQGYRLISFQDFKLDGKQLSETNAKLIMTGVYNKPDDVEVLQPSSMAIIMAKKGYGDNLSVPLLTEGATRQIRKSILNCNSNLGMAQLGCPITLVGHADVCSARSLLESKKIACFVVEDGW